MLEEDKGAIYGIGLAFLLFVVASFFTHIWQLPLGVDSYYYIHKLQGVLHVQIPPLWYFQQAHYLQVWMLLSAMFMLTGVLLKYYARQRWAYVQIPAYAFACALVLILVLASGTASLRFAVYEPDDFTGITLSVLAATLALAALSESNGQKTRYALAVLGASVVLFAATGAFVWAGAFVAAAVFYGVYILIFAATPLRLLSLHGRQWGTWDALIAVAVGTVLTVVIRATVLPASPMVSEQSGIANLGVLLFIFALIPAVWRTHEKVSLSAYAIFAGALVTLATFVPKFAQLAGAFAIPIIAADITYWVFSKNRRQSPVWGVGDGYLILSAMLIAFGMASTFVGLASFVQWQADAMSIVGYGATLAQDSNLPLVNFWDIGYWVWFYSGNMPKWTPANWHVTYPKDARAVYVMPQPQLVQYCKNPDQYMEICSASLCTWVKREMGWLLGNLIYCPAGNDETVICAAPCRH